ncbi:MAG TPA: alpha/beta fold hydrolase [Stellaceae bacterium]|nr:alpha/beta fold hydrolase [Stellaceae bacterium]
MARGRSPHPEPRPSGRESKDASSSIEADIGGTHVRATGAGAPLLLIHGVGLDLEIWEPLVPLLQRRRRLIRYDMRGHGASAKPPGPYRLDNFVDQLDRLAAALELDRFDLAGFSMGGLVAEAFAARFPERVRRLALLHTVHDRNAAERTAVAQRLAQVEAGDLEGSIESAIARWLNTDFRKSHPEAVAAIERRMRSNDRAAYLASYRVFATADAEVLGVLDHVRCPTLVLTGEHDTGSTPAMAKALAARLRAATLAILPGLRHLALLEEPEQVAVPLDRFFAI